MLTIARLNWPPYLVSALLLVACAVVFWKVPAPAVRIGCAAVFASAAYFAIGSLAVSHWVYDRSDLYCWRWLERALRGAVRGDFIFCHAGFDEASRSLHAHLGDVGWRVLDHFDPARMTEPSIHRARRLFPPEPGTLAATFDRWPIADASADVIFALLAIHELRSEAERTAWFAEARRCLRAGGRIVLVEHTRDLANAVAFGPGALHFHSVKSWRRCWTRAGLQAADTFSLTPWLRVFILTAP
jgi:SAM-dependent methyltransferase